MKIKKQQQGEFLYCCIVQQ